MDDVFFLNHRAVNLFILQVDFSFYFLETYLGTSSAQYVFDSLKFPKFSLFQLAAGFTYITIFKLSESLKLFYETSYMIYNK